MERRHAHADPRARRAAVPDADRRARDRRLDDVERRRWRAMRREIEAVAADPDRVAGAAMAARLAAHAAQLDEPEPGTEVTRADLLELDLRGDAGSGPLRRGSDRRSSRGPQARLGRA